MSEHKLKDNKRIINNCAQNWDSLANLFAEDAIIKDNFAGFPNIISNGDWNTAHAGFKPSMGKYTVKYNYLHGMENDCMFSFSAYLETKSGKGAVYTRHGYWEFNEEGNNEEGKIVKNCLYLDNSDKVAKYINEYMSGLE